MEPPFCEDFLVVKAMSRILGNLLYVGGGMPANIDMNQFLGRSNSLVWLLESQQDTKLGHQGQGSVKERQCGWTWYFGHGHKACGVLCFTLMPKRDRESKQDREAHFVQMQQYLFRQRKCSDRIMIMGKSTSINIYLLPRSSQSDTQESGLLTVPKFYCMYLWPNDRVCPQWHPTIFLILQR